MASIIWGRNQDSLRSSVGRGMSDPFPLSCAAVTRNVSLGNCNELVVPCLHLYVGDVSGKIDKGPQDLLKSGFLSKLESSISVQ